MKTYILVIFIGLSMTGCTPASVFTLTPAESEIEWIDGIGMVNKTDRDIFISVGFIENRDGMLSFNIFIENGSENTIAVDPAKFECADKSASGNKNLPVEKSVSNAIDPEVKIRQIDAAISDENANYRLFSTVDFCGSVLSLIGSVVSVGKQKTEEEIQDEEIIAADNLRRVVGQDNEHADRINSFNSEKEFWQNQALRKTTLPPGQTVEGNIYFNPLSESELIRLRFPIDQVCFEILFKQKKITQ
jgi:hypothetical protein